MLLRLLISLGLTGFLMGLVVLQMWTASRDKFLTVENLFHMGHGGLSLDRHYAISIDFCILAPFIGLVVFACAKEWGRDEMLTMAAISIFVTCIFVWMWSGGNEAHAHDRHTTAAGMLHGVYMAIVLWTILMVFVFTPKPDPMLLLVMCVVVTAFLFVGTHKYLGLINMWGDARTYDGQPLKDGGGWAVIIGATLLMGVRAYFLIPSSFWQGLK
ncbi:hypothetical protein H7X87_04355 [Acetobacteraceae bacterium]|nr:hypothetical protein [Candidatus Parcubacteria bacterium]